MLVDHFESFKVNNSCENARVESCVCDVSDVLDRFDCRKRPGLCLPPFALSTQGLSCFFGCAHAASSATSLHRYFYCDADRLRELSFARFIGGRRSQLHSAGSSGAPAHNGHRMNISARVAFSYVAVCMFVQFPARFRTIGHDNCSSSLASQHEAIVRREAQQSPRSRIEDAADRDFSITKRHAAKLFRRSFSEESIPPQARCCGTG